MDPTHRAPGGGGPRTRGKTQTGRELPESRRQGDRHIGRSREALHRSAGSGRRRVDAGEQVGLDGCRVRHGSRREHHWLHWHPRPAFPAGGWSMGVFRIRFGCFSFGFSPPACRAGTRSGLAGDRGRLGRGADRAGGRLLCQPLPRHLLQGAAPGDWLKLKQINHLRRTSDASHYSVLPHPRGALFAAGKPAIPWFQQRRPRPCST